MMQVIGGWSVMATGLGLWAQEEAPLPEPPGSAVPTAAEQLVTAALFRLEASVRYDPSYVVLPYPGGDVPAETGVCTDVVIRSYRQAFAWDLQRLVHEDMNRNFSKYPKRWGLKRPDKNIDHRRVPNLQTFLEREGAALPITEEASDYLPGDVVAWDLNGKGLTHIGIVVPGPEGAAEGGWIVHNIGAGPQRERCLFDWKILGHYRFLPDGE
ncbi:MAG: DUF1287 domain-containing protein [Verrucomicrobiota bacterium]